MLRNYNDSDFEIEELPDDFDQKPQQKQIKSVTDQNQTESATVIAAPAPAPVRFDYEPLNAPALNELFNGELEFELFLPVPRLVPESDLSKVPNIAKEQAVTTIVNAVVKPLPAVTPPALTPTHAENQHTTREDGNDSAIPLNPQKCPRLPSDRVYQILRIKKRREEDSESADHDSDYASPSLKLFKPKDESFRRITRSQVREEEKLAVITTNNKGPG